MMNKTLLDFIKTNPLGLSPMSGISDGPFRRVCRHGGAGLLVAPMLAARHLINKPVELPQEQHFAEVEHPIGIQLIAANPDEAFKASAILGKTNYDFIELNASCPSRRIIAMGCGSALLPKPGLIREILGAMVEGAKTKQITLKIRLGLRSGNFTAIDLIRELAGPRSLYRPALYPPG
jgi:tRNA-dihydrouridine synthase B